MTLEWSDPVVTAVNFVGLPSLQLAIAWLSHKLPDRWFDAAIKEPAPGPDVWWRWIGIQRWKDLLPDGGSWFSHGFEKARLRERDPGYLERFVRETRRGEFCHWLAIACICVFFLWNPWWADLVIAGYALIANLPCILVQRYNRGRLTRVILRSRRAR